MSEFLRRKGLSRGAAGLLSALAITSLGGCIPGSVTYKPIRIPENALRIPGSKDQNFVVYPQDVNRIYCGHMHLPNFIWDDNDSPNKKITPYLKSGLVLVTCETTDSAYPTKDYPVTQFETNSGEPVINYLHAMQQEVAAQAK